MHGNVNGGTAFPVISKIGVDPTDKDVVHFASYPGMSLRDYFAAQALDRVGGDVMDRLADPDGVAWDEVDDANKLVAPPQEIARRMAVAAYLIADAMLAEREKGGAA